jgi:hypothetical protein
MEAELKVYMASVTHPKGVNLYVGGSKTELLSKLAEYIREHPPEDWPSGSAPTVELSDEETVDLYFDGNEREFLDEDNCDITPPSISRSRPTFDDSFRPAGDVFL